VGAARVTGGADGRRNRGEVNITKYHALHNTTLSGRTDIRWHPQ